jgi:hypothetical protein
MWILAISLAYPIGGEGGYFIRLNYFYLPSLRVEEGARVSTLWFRLASHASDRKKH